MKDNLNFLWPKDRPKFQIMASMDGISTTIGHNGYRVIVYEAIKYEGQKALAKFTIELNGQLAKSMKGDFNEVLCIENDLGKIIIAETWERYKYNIVKGEPNSFTDLVKYGNFSSHILNQNVGFNNKDYVVVGTPYKSKDGDHWIIDLEQV